MFNDFDQQTNDFTMSDNEIASHKKVLSRLCFAFLAYFIIANGLSFAAAYLLNSIAPNLLLDSNFTLIISSAIQYAIAFPILYFLVRKMPKCAPFPNKIGVKKFLKYTVISVFVMYVGTYISSLLMVYLESLMGNAPTNSIDDILNNTNIILSTVLVGIVGPIVEELMFRKLFVDRLTPYGELTAIFFPALIFGLFHTNLYQFFYAFFLGAIFSYVYLRTGKIIYTIILHLFINVFFGILPTFITSNINLEEFLEIALSGNIPEEYIMANLVPLTCLLVYEFVSYGLIFAGVITFMKSIRRVVLNKGSVRVHKGVAADVIFFNIGAILLITICLIFTALNTFII